MCLSGFHCRHKGKIGNKLINPIFLSPINSSCSHLENFVLYFLAHQISVNSEPVKTIECSFRECFQLSESISAWRWTLMSAILTSWHLHLYYLPCFSAEAYSQENQANIMFFTCGSNVNVLLGLKVWRTLKKDRFVKLSVLLLKIFHPKLQIWTSCLKR